MGTSPNPYRINSIEPDNSKLSEKGANDLAKIILNELSSKRYFDYKIISKLDASGYKLKNDVYLRQGKFVPSFPESNVPEVPIGDRFTVIYETSFDERDKIIVNGRIHTLDSAMRDIDIIAEIIGNYGSYKNYLSPSIFHSFIKRVNHKKDFRKKVSMLSSHAEGYLFGASALRLIDNEYYNGERRKSNLRDYRELIGKGLKLTPDDFWGIKNTFDWYRVESDYELLKLPTLRKYSQDEIKLLMEVLWPSSQ